MKTSKPKWRTPVFGIALFAMFLSLLAQTTPLWAKKQQNGDSLVICSAFGFKTIFLDENGNKLPDAPSTKQTKKHCVMCFAANTNAPLPTTQTTAITFLETESRKFNIYQAAHHKSASSKNNAIRAPPQTS